MTKFRIPTSQDPTDSFSGILKYYAVGGLIALVLVAGFAYWQLG